MSLLDSRGWLVNTGIRGRGLVIGMQYRSGETSVDSSPPIKLGNAFTLAVVDTSKLED
ncbi:hypothetical protein [Candidatus Nitrotoga arctica]|uniref:hypothetical protein n=1 Tax=Candidatus Nitrotoga arctica TaxID=453162 RepID=UPI001EFA9E15|nr:hypothetical protein [Candidatus Nitrotoga arctica]